MLLLLRTAPLYPLYQHTLAATAADSTATSGPAFDTGALGISAASACRFLRLGLVGVVMVMVLAGDKDDDEAYKGIYGRA